ncbi:4Fe-4S binding protein [Pyrobaculum neutrophilum]|uniref:4Fe-4S ferredoxin iron-sulfur binding domain protein n=1 Tax=Pyrobaculum neutrophilum (strain DSM 2338 / JCM 9278 / NBRC 100436 / V24Sta) TaxID=444157 RepID=B1YBG5_PYRNV|nr:4Fe-4S binding protein [Pyrobaculum neutrophilum]ACB40767.1 4Fe-4S ferredoxin iron-sulfur binding domain protein [Pyrobaculum neutrophilum V24Sta]
MSDKPSIVIVEGREDLSRRLSRAPLYFAYRGPHGEWFRTVAEKHLDTDWSSLPPAEVKAAARRELITGGFIRLRDTVVVDQAKCIWCGMCAKSCPATAFEYVERRSIRVMYDRCVDCGLCNALCPVEAVKMPSLPDGFLAELIKTAPGPLKFICDYAFQDGDEEGVRVKCIAAIPKQYLYIAAAKYGEARAHCSRGERCPLWPAVERWGAGLAREGRDFVVRAEKAPLQPGDRWQTRMLAAALGMPVGRVEVAEGCTLCGACVNVCPTDALSIKGFELRLTPALCIACGVCAEKCPERVVRVAEAREDKPYESRAIFRDSPAKCSSCGKPLPYTETMARKLAERLKERGLPHEHIYLCEECRLSSSPV